MNPTPHNGSPLFQSIQLRIEVPASGRANYWRQTGAHEVGTSRTNLSSTQCYQPAEAGPRPEDRGKQRSRSFRRQGHASPPSLEWAYSILGMRELPFDVDTCTDVVLCLLVPMPAGYPARESMKVSCDRCNRGGSRMARSPGSTSIGCRR